MRKPLRSIMVGTAIVSCVMIAGTALTADHPRDSKFESGPKVAGTQNPGDASRGILQYDDGVPVSRDGSTGPNTPFIGNRFNPGLPAGAHTITAASFNLAGLFGNAAVIGFFGPAAGTAAPFLGFQVITGLAGPGWVTAPVAPSVAAGSGSFLVGIINTTYVPCAGNTGIGTTCEGVALGPGVNGWGHNAMRISVTGTLDPAGSGFATIQGQNALLRAIGGNIPVELMRLDVE